MELGLTWSANTIPPRGQGVLSALCAFMAEVEVEVEVHVDEGGGEGEGVVVLPQASRRRVGAELEVDVRCSVDEGRC